MLLYSALSTDGWGARDLCASAPAAALVIGWLLAAIPRQLRAAAVALVLAIPIAGTTRAIIPSYARPSFRAAARYLDGVAAPRDPIVVYPSFLALDRAIPVQFQKPHLVLSQGPARWPTPPRGGYA